MLRVGRSWLKIHYKIRPSAVLPWLSPKWLLIPSEIKKKMLCKDRFSDIPDIQRNVTTFLRGIPETGFQDCFRQSHHRLTKCIASHRRYFEGDSFYTAGLGIKLSHHIFSVDSFRQNPVWLYSLQRTSVLCCVSLHSQARSTSLSQKQSVLLSGSQIVATQSQRNPAET